MIAKEVEVVYTVNGGHEKTVIIPVSRIVLSYLKLVAPSDYDNLDAMKITVRDSD